MYLSQIVKCISLKLHNVFVSNCKMYFSQIVKMSQIVKLSTCCLLSATIWQSVQVKQPLSPPIAAPFTSGSETLPRLNFQSPPFHTDQDIRTKALGSKHLDQEIWTKTLGSRHSDKYTGTKTLGRRHSDQDIRFGSRHLDWQFLPAVSHYGYAVGPSCE